MPGLNGFDRAASKEDFAHAKRFDKWFYSFDEANDDEKIKQHRRVFGKSFSEGPEYGHEQEQEKPCRMDHK